MGPIFSLLYVSCNVLFHAKHCGGIEIRNIYFLRRTCPSVRLMVWAESMRHVAALALDSAAKLESSVRSGSPGASHVVKVGWNFTFRGTGIWAPARLFRSLCALQGQPPASQTKGMLLLLHSRTVSILSSGVFSLLSRHFPGFLHPGASLFALGNRLWSVTTVYCECPGIFAGICLSCSALLPVFGSYFVC